MLSINLCFPVGATSWEKAAGINVCRAGAGIAVVSCRTEDLKDISKVNMAPAGTASTSCDRSHDIMSNLSCDLLHDFQYFFVCNHVICALQLTCCLVCLLWNAMKECFTFKIIIYRCQVHILFLLLQ